LTLNNILIRHGNGDGDTEASEN